MYLFQLFILFLHSIPNCSTPPYPYPISLLYGWYNEAFLHGNIGKNGIKVLDWHYSEYLGDINSSNEKMTKIAIVTQTILFNESSTLYATNLIRISHLLFWLHYRFVSHYNLCGILQVRQKLSDFLVSNGNEKHAERNLPECDPSSPQINKQICESYAHVIDEMNFLMFLRRMETEEFQQIIKKISKSKANLKKIKEKLDNLFGSARTEILRYALPEFNYVFAFERSEFSELKEFYMTYFDDSLLILKWRNKQYIEYSLIIEDKNFDDEEKMIWSEMTKYYWYGDTEMQIQYVELNDLTEKQIAQNISRYYLNIETIAEKELHPKTPSYILAVNEAIEEIKLNTKIEKKNLKNKQEIINNKISNIKKIVYKKMKKDNSVYKNCESRRKMHADKLVEFMINKNSAIKEDKLEDSVKKTTNEELRKLTGYSKELFFEEIEKRKNNELKNENENIEEKINEADEIVELRDEENDEIKKENENIEEETVNKTNLDESAEIVEIKDEENNNKLEVPLEENKFKDENLFGQEMVEEGKLSFNKLDHEIIALINLNDLFEYSQLESTELTTKFKNYLSELYSTLMQKTQKDKLFDQMLLFINICLMTKLIEEKLEIKLILLNKNLIEKQRKNEDFIKFKKLKINWTKLKKNKIY